MYQPQAHIDRSLANGIFIKPDKRDYNAPVTGIARGFHPTPAITHILSNGHPMHRENAR